MFYYYHPESESLFCTLKEMPTGYLINNIPLEELTQERFMEIGLELDLFFKVSQSKVKTYRRCHRAYHNKYIRGLQKRLKAKPLFMGSVIHSCLELFLLGKPWKKPLKAAQKEIDKMFDEEAVEFADMIPTSEAMMEGYIKTHEQSGLDVIDVEIHLEVPLIDNIIFIGYVDSLLEERDNPGRIWQLEHKTCKSIPDEKTRMSDIQTILYDWALPLAGHPKPIGVMWDYLKKKIPVVPELLKKGGLSRNKKMDTTPEVYLKAINDNNLNPDDYQEELENLRGREDSFHRRIKMPVSQAAVDSVVEDLRSTAIQIKNIGHLVKDRNMTRDCSWCDYYPICQSELRDGDTERLIKLNYTTREQRDAQSKKQKVKSKKAR